MHFLLTALVFIVMITVLVASHEYGHYLFARLFRMEVEEFAIGMGKPKWVWMRKKGTEYTVRPLPIGGFVRIKGMTPQDDGGEIHIENGFYSKPPLARLIVLFAGPLFSVLAGLILLVALFTMVGEHSKSPTLGELVVNDPAAKAGLKTGDLVLSVNGIAVTTWTQMQDLIRPNPGQQLTMRVKRGNETLTKNLVSLRSDKPMEFYDDDGNSKGPEAYYGMIGVYSPMALEKVPFGEAVSEACSMPISLIKGLFSIVKKPSNFGQMMGGPGTIVKATSDATTEGFYPVVFLAAALSISIGILNLLPIFPLDGGQMAVAFAELLRRRRLSIQTQGAVQSLGMALIGMLIVSVLWVDFRRFQTPDELGPKPPQATAAPAPTPTQNPAKPTSTLDRNKPSSNKPSEAVPKPH